MTDYLCAECHEYDAEGPSCEDCGDHLCSECAAEYLSSEDDDSESDNENMDGDGGERRHLCFDCYDTRASLCGVCSVKSADRAACARCKNQVCKMCVVNDGYCRNCFTTSPRFLGWVIAKAGVQDLEALRENFRATAVVE